MYHPIMFVCLTFLHRQPHFRFFPPQRPGQNLLTMMWMSIAVFLLWMRAGGCAETANTSDLIEYTAADFYENLYSGKMMFIYFERQGKLLALTCKLFHTFSLHFSMNR